MKANPDITVKVSNVGQPNETYTALNNAAQAGSGLPDVTLIEYLAIPQFVHSDTLMDLSKVYDTAKLKDTFTPGTWNSVNINGGLYAMPADSGPMAYFYDKDVFDKAGISEPSTRPASANHRPPGTSSTKTRRRSAPPAPTSPPTPATVACSTR